MKTNNLTETFYHYTYSGFGPYTYQVMDCPKERVNLVCNMLSNLAKLYELEEFHSYGDSIGYEFYGCNITEEERLAAEFDLTTLCYAEHIAIYNVCLELKDSAGLTDGYHKTIPEYFHKKRIF